MACWKRERNLTMYIKKSEQQALKTYIEIAIEAIEKAQRSDNPQEVAFALQTALKSARTVRAIAMP